MKAVLMHQSITTHDAIGNDIFHMYQILERKHQAYVYCTYLLNEDLKRIDRKTLLDLISDENNLVIYHHSNYWEEGEEILERARARVIVRYHCITPPEFFESYSEDYYLLCKHGRSQTSRLAHSNSSFFWMSDSYHNLVDAGMCDRGNATVIPPFNNLELWRNVAPDEAILKRLMESPVINLLFVGRVAPNKGHKYLIEIARDYLDHYSSDIAIYVIGKKDDKLGAYYKELDEMIDCYGLQEKFVWVQEVTDPILLSYYLGCDFYLNCSEHEGFCVPIIEAQSLCLPVISRATSAIPETTGAGQLLLGDDVCEHSAAIHILTENRDYRDYLVRMGQHNYLTRFTNSAIEERFVEAVQSCTGVRL